MKEKHNDDSDQSSDYVDNKVKENVDDFRSKLNTSQGVLISDDLLLTTPFSDISANLLKSFGSTQQVLNDVSSSESKIGSVAASLFALLDKFSGNIGSLSTDRTFLRNIMPGIFTSINDVIASLDIGMTVSDGVDEIKSTLLNVIQVLDEAKGSESFTKSFNDAALSVAKATQTLILSIAVLAESAASKILGLTTELKETTVSLTLILQTVVVLVQSFSISIASSEITSTSSILNSFLVIVDRLLPVITDVLASITSASVVSSVSVVITTLGVTLSAIGKRLIESTDKLYSGIVLEVPNNLENVLLKFIGADSDFAGYVTTSTVTIASCIAAISSCDAGMHSKVSRQLYPTFRSLYELAGSDDEIASELKSSLSNMMSQLKTASNALVFGIGAEITSAFIESMGNVFDTLQKMIDMLDRKNINTTHMTDITVECAKAVQIFGSVVVAISETISREIGSVNAAALEAVISLPIIHTAVVYAVEWVTAVTSSICLTKTGAVDEIVSSLSAVMVVHLKQDSKILEIIAGSTNKLPANVVNLIIPEVRGIGKAGTSLSTISQVKANTNVKIEQLSPGGDRVTVERNINKVEGNLPQILNGLTGSLSSISPTLSSSLNGLRKSFNQIISAKFGMLKTVGSLLNSVITDLTNISGSAAQVLHSTSKSLYSIFGRILETISKLAQIGDLVAAFIGSVTSVSNGLHSLLHAVNDYKLTEYFIADSLRELTKAVQIVLSTFAAVINSAEQGSKALREKLSSDVAGLCYVVSTTIVVVQHVIGSTIPSVSATTGTIQTVQHDLTHAMSIILEHFSSIVTDSTMAVVDDVLEELPRNILSLVAQLSDYNVDLLGKISGVKANIEVNLSLAEEAP